MAQGDVKAGITSVAANSMWTIQPPAGEHWLVKRIFSDKLVGTAPDAVPQVGFILFNGARSSHFGHTADPSISARLYQQELNIGVNNVTYFRLFNGAGSSRNLGYSAIQIK